MRNWWSKICAFEHFTGPWKVFKMGSIEKKLNNHCFRFLLIENENLWYRKSRICLTGMIPVQWCLLSMPFVMRLLHCSSIRYHIRLLFRNHFPLVSKQNSANNDNISDQLACLCGDDAAFWILPQHLSPF